MERMKFESDNLVDNNIEKIEKLFPNCITEGKDENGKLKKAINFDMLKQMLSEDVVEGDEAYEFTWVGKKESIVEAHKPIRKTLRPCKEESVNWDKTENLYIEGDNLDVFKLLQESYLNKVKMIYIDPPYNTGNDFIYRDKFSRSQEDENREMGMYDEDNNKLFRNTDTNGRFHSDWCKMIYPRLMLARNLLSNDGVIFISIDDSEVHNLKSICDEIFGIDSYITCIPRICSFQRSGQEKHMNVSHDYILCYSYGDDFNSIVKKEIDENKVKVDKNGKYISGDTKAIFAALSQGYSKGGDYDFEYNGKIYKPEDSKGNRNRWLWSKERMQAAADLGILVETGKTLRMQLYLDKKFEEGTNTLVDRDNMLKFHTADFMKEKFDNPVGTKELKNIFEGKEYFDNPKPTRLIKYLINLATNKNSVVMDFFSGSATTAHAVMQLNAEDGGNRKFIMVQLPEHCDEKSEAFKAGYKNICEIGKERIRRAGKKIIDENPDKADSLDIGFRTFKLDSTNMKDVYYSAGDYTQNLLDSLESNIKPDRTDLDLLFGCLLEWGLPLSMPYKSEVIDGYNVITYDEDYLIACFDENISDEVIKAIAERKPLHAVFRDSSFKNSPSKINSFEIFKMISPDTKLRVI